jgi:hypothetical protein
MNHSAKSVQKSIMPEEGLSFLAVLIATDILSRFLSERCDDAINTPLQQLEHCVKKR